MEPTTNSSAATEPNETVTGREAAPDDSHDSESKPMEVVADVPRDAKPAADAMSDSSSPENEASEVEETSSTKPAARSIRPFNRIRRFFSTAGK
jgi:hypothetical protein